MTIDAPVAEAIAPQALDLLLTRRSPWPVAEPIPSEAELQRAFAATMCAPDHGALRPWRFVLIRGAARERLGDLFVQAARLRDPAGDAERFRRKALVAPLLVAVVAHLQPHPKVPEIEQTVATGAAAMNLLNALHLQGYGCFWVSGPNAYDPTVHAGLGLAANEQLLGFVYVGTPQSGDKQPPARAAAAPHVREWCGPAAGR
ncbi:nitroreductase [Pseudorhodoferax sp. Leaf265]|uniref:nitroreductase family protein n=1 Tax=Pseudorhodoferax sp. Leaf265 TaxID=1736315 RepID=UPI0006F401AF|nr:nitroreductase [Pseudorhodoferax sp. Leaf265]KQP14499.1 nitroreductase [Pseudorhodoferax sp. Leaf265]